MILNSSSKALPKITILYTVQSKPTIGNVDYSKLQCMVQTIYWLSYHLESLLGEGGWFPLCTSTVTTLFPSHSPIFWIGMASGHPEDISEPQWWLSTRAMMCFVPAPPTVPVPTVPLLVGWHGRCVVATVPTEARFGPRHTIVPEVEVEDIVVGALLKHMTKNHTHKDLH